VLLEDLERFEPALVIKDGEVVEPERPAPVAVPDWLRTTVNIAPVSPDDLRVCARGARVRVIELVPDQLLTFAREADPKTDGERFFVELKGWTTFGYYTSRIGIHDEMEYKGNTLLAEFSGTDPATLPAIPPPGEPLPVKP